MATAAVTAAKASAATVAHPDMLARDAMIAWYRGEFAAANAIIDALCSHIAQIAGASSEYDALFTAIHHRRLNWIPVLHMQRYFSVADVVSELSRVAANRKPPTGSDAGQVELEGSVDSDCTVGEYSSAESSNRKISGGGKALDSQSSDDGESHEEQTLSENVQICTNHEECAARPEKIKICKGFVAKAPVKGNMVNVVKGLKVYQNMFTNFELLKLTEYVNQLRLAGRRGELAGETFIFFNKQTKGNKREIIQLGVPLFQRTNVEAGSSIDPIPQILLSVIDHLTQWRLIPECRRPNSCIISFFDEDEYSQPYFKSPHLENPISTLFLSETTTAFGRVLPSDQNGDYKGTLTLPLSEGSLLVMRGNSADMARHVVCPSPSRRVSITFLKVKPAANQVDTAYPNSQQSNAITLWQPSPPIKAPDAGGIAYGPHAIVSTWGFSLRAPVFMLAPTKPVVTGQGRRFGRGGTGVFLPWNLGLKRYIKHLPPRIQKRRLPSQPTTL